MCYRGVGVFEDEAAAGIYDESEAQCPECGSRSWDFLVKNVCGDIVGCEECVTKLYLEELSEMYLDDDW